MKRTCPYECVFVCARPYKTIPNSVFLLGCKNIYAYEFYSLLQTEYNKHKNRATELKNTLFIVYDFREPFKVIIFIK